MLSGCFGFRFVASLVVIFWPLIFFIDGLPINQQPLDEIENANTLQKISEKEEENNPKFVRSTNSENTVLGSMEDFKPLNCRNLPSLVFDGKSDDLLWTEPSDKLFDLLKPNVYNKHLAPGQATGNVTMVNIAFYIESMSTFRAQSMDFEVDMYLAMSWTDHRLKHNCAHPILITDTHITEQMWQPDLYFVNSKVAFVHQVLKPNFMVLVYDDGFVFKSMRVDVVLSCLLRLEYFPMDSQECSVVIQSYAYVQNVLNLSWHVDSEKGYPISYNDNLQKGLSDMDLINRTWNRCDGDYPMFRGMGRWSCLQGNIIMKRKLRFHIFQLFIPTAVLVCISWCSFWLDIRASPARITLTITTLLTLTTMGNGSRQNLPQVSYMKSIDTWGVVCQAFVFSVLLEYTLVNFFLGQKTYGCKKHMVRFHQMDNNKDGCSKNFPSSSVDPHVACGVCSDLWELYAKRVDKISRVAYPLGFSVFIIAYWFSYYDQLKTSDLF